MQNSSMFKAKITSRRPWLLAIGGILSLAAIALGVRYGKPQGKDLAKTLKVERKNIVQSLQLSGKVTPEKTMVITAQQSGRIVSLNAKEGIKVESGDLLFTMQLEASGQTELMEMRAHVKSLEQEVASSSQLVKNKNSVKELIGFDQVAREESNLEKLKIELNSARERLNIVEANLGLSHVGASKLKNSADRSGLVYVRSPIQGIVTLVDKRPGDFVLGGVGSAGSGSSEFGGNNERMVMVVADMSKLQVRIKVMESDLRFIKLGLPVKVRLDAYPEMSYEGQVEQIGGQGRTEVKAGYTYFDVIVA
ncbi:MAG: efflux RND transporter periplasmic adaptor subunit, partial [Proteobacteria bacterium]|nr:efflux RND transporter periplasmic adaptor subunit [Pseudomonadota bacterium]